MRTLWKQFGDESARHAWISVGAPILGLVLVIIALAVSSFAGFARQHDRAFVESTQRLAASAMEGRGASMANLVVDFANWDASVENISDRWDDAWVNGNIYSSIADAMLILRSDGSVRYAWFSDKLGDATSGVQQETINRVVTIPHLRRLARAATPADSAGRTYAMENGRILVIAVAPVTVEDNAARLAAPPGASYDYIAAVDVIEVDELAAFGRALNLQDFAFSAPGETPAGVVSVPVLTAGQETIGRLHWRHTHPGAASFQRQIWPVILSLLGVGAMTMLIARTLVSHQIEAHSSAKAAREASLEKSELLARVSTELRTPLNAVIGYAEIIQEEAASPASRDDAQRIIEAARELSNMLGDIIDQSRIDAGSMRLKPEVVPVAGLLAEVQGLMHPVAQAAGIEVEVTQEATAAYAYADYARLRQCLMKIVGNAVKFSPRGGVVRMRARLVREDTRQFIVIAVSDSGIGIAADAAAKIFRPFGQANPAIGAVYGGAGLGLSIARALARDMGGDLSVVSEEGEGATFYLQTPAASARALSAA
jgi:signal transduction histidine kinase